MALSTYHQHYDKSWILRYGTYVMLRPIEPEDEDMVIEFLSTLSVRTVLFRFFRILEPVTHKQMTRYNHIDHDGCVSIVAVEHEPERDRIIGEGRLTYYPNLGACEFSIVVGDPWQGKGLGAKLIKMCIDIAREKGVKFLWGNIMSGNERMIGLCKKLDFHIQRHHWEGIVRASMELS
jgi:acetyltransferase